LSEAQSVDAAVAAARGRLRGVGIVDAEADLDARLLAQHALGWNAARLLTHGDQVPPAAFAKRYAALVERRARREPTAYVLGWKEFWSLPFDVSPAVLIPRPESELIVEAAVARYRERDARIQVADIGTGSGCLAVAIAHELSTANVIATDLSTDALSLAAANARRHGVADRVQFVRADLLDPTDPRTFDLIVSNPPYIPEGLRDTLPPEVRDYEPPAALFAGPDGLAMVRRLLPLARERLAPSGWLIFEFGFGQADAVRQLIADARHLRMVDLKTDLRGIPRTAVVRR
jgi:release factor glutamine methyltransferase